MGGLVLKTVLVVGFIKTVFYLIDNYFGESGGGSSNSNGGGGPTNIDPDPLVPETPGGKEHLENYVDPAKVVSDRIERNRKIEENQKPKKPA